MVVGCAGGGGERVGLVCPLAHFDAVAGCLGRPAATCPSTIYTFSSSFLIHWPWHILETY